MLYMLGQRIIDQRRGSYLIPKCLIKVGVTRNINKRMCNYRSDNPSAIFISETAGVEYEESQCHSFLNKNGKSYGGEWYEVTEEFYEKCWKEGFSFFPLKNKKQNVYMHNQYCLKPIVYTEEEKIAISKNSKMKDFVEFFYKYEQ